MVSFFLLLLLLLLLFDDKKEEVKSKDICTRKALMWRDVEVGGEGGGGGWWGGRCKGKLDLKVKL